MAERRLVTVMFVDLVGFTPWSEGRDSELVREMLSRYFDLATAVVDRYGGTIEKFIGDAVMAVWGAPVAHEDDAELAVRAALDLVAEVPSLAPGIQGRAGVLTGEAAASIGALNQGMVAGDLVNTAARIQSAADPGTVLVGEQTWGAASRAIAFEPAGDRELKGKAEPVRVWRALRVIAEVGGRNRVEGLEAPMVGRDEELRQLRDLFHLVAREGRPRSVWVSGPAGIGKTRLAWEFEKYIDGVRETVWWHRGRSMGGDQGVPFRALAEMVRERAGLLDTDDDATTRERVRTALETHVPDPEERSWIEPALLVLLGQLAEVTPERLFGAWRMLFERMAATAPVVLVFEDLHQADSGTLGFIDHLLDWVRSVPILVVTLGRPELLERRPGWGAGRRSWVAIPLEPLSSERMAELLGGLAPGLSEDTVSVIIERAEGIPLYAVELVRMLKREDGRVRALADTDRLELPASLTSLVLARLDQLPARQRSLLREVSVLGERFVAAAVDAVTGQPVSITPDLLAALVRAELLRIEADPRAPDRGVLCFVQGVIREVAYGTLTRHERMRLHLAAARYLEADGIVERAPAVASHLLAAWEAARGSDEEPRLAAEVLRSLLAAADRISSLSGHAQVIVLMDVAERVATDDLSLADVLQRRALALRAEARHAEAVDSAVRAGERARAVGDLDLAWRALAIQAGALSDDGRTAEGLALLVAERHLMVAAGTDAAADALAALARQRWVLGHDPDTFAVVLHDAEAALAIAERRHQMRPLVIGMSARGSALLDLGRVVEGRVLLEAADRLAVDHDLVRERLLTLNGLTLLSLGRPLVAAAHAEEGVRIARRLGHRTQTAVHFYNWATSAMHAGLWDEVVRAIREIDDGAFAAQDEASFRQVLVIILVSRGEPIDVEWARLRELTGASDEPFMRGLAMEARARIAHASADLASAQRLLIDVHDLWPMDSSFAALAAESALVLRDPHGARSALMILRGRAQGVPMDDTRLRSVEAGIAALDDDMDAARAGWHGALAAWDQIDCPFDAGITAITMATLLRPLEPADLDAIDRARAGLIRLRARPYIERLDAVISAAEAKRPAS